MREPSHSEWWQLKSPTKQKTKVKCIVQCWTGVFMLIVWCFCSCCNGTAFLHFTFSHCIICIMLLNLLIHEASICCIHEQDWLILDRFHLIGIIFSLLFRWMWILYPSQCYTFKLAIFKHSETTSNQYYLINTNKACRTTTATFWVLFSINFQIFTFYSLEYWATSRLTTSYT